MEQEPRMASLVDTTDCLEAVSVIRCWKNLLFVAMLLCLLLLLMSFWMVNLNGVKSDQPAVAADSSEQVAQVSKPGETTAEKIKQAAMAAVAADSNEPTQAQAPAEENEKSAVSSLKELFRPKLKHITALVRFVNFVLIPASVFYCLTMLFTLKISLIGRLGGINHIARAFFLSLLFVVLLMPWQLMFAPVFAGAMFTPCELISACQAEKNVLAYISFYLRFPGYWLLVLLMLLAAQIRSIRWARATLRRLEVV